MASRQQTGQPDHLRYARDAIRRARSRFCGDDGCGSGGGDPPLGGVSLSCCRHFPADSFFFVARRRGSVEESLLAHPLVVEDLAEVVPAGIGEQHDHKPVGVLRRDSYGTFDGHAARTADQEALDVSEPPRSVGKVETTLRGTTLTRSVGSYTHWNVLRVLDRHRALPEAERQRVEKAIAGTGWEELLAYAPRHRLTKRGFALAFA